MTFWNALAVEPKRNFRWECSLELFQPGNDKKVPDTFGSIQRWTVTSWTAPKLNLEVNEQIGPLGNLWRQPRHSKWDDVTIVMHDMASDGKDNNTKMLYSWLKANGYDPKKSPARMVHKLGKVTLASLQVMRLNAAGKTVDAWGFNWPILYSVEFGSTFDYSSDELSLITITFKPQTCTYVQLKSDKS